MSYFLHLFFVQLTSSLHDIVSTVLWTIQMLLLNVWKPILRFHFYAFFCFVLTEQTSHLVFAFSGSGDTLSISDEQTIEEYVKYYHIKVSAILVPNDNRLPMAFYDSLAQLSGGSSHVIREFKHRTVKTYVELLDSFRDLLRSNRGSITEVCIIRKYFYAIL